MCPTIFSSGFKFFFFSSCLLVIVFAASAVYWHSMPDVIWHTWLHISVRLLQIRHKGPILRLMFLKFILRCHDQSAKDKISRAGGNSYLHTVKCSEYFELLHFLELFWTVTASFYEVMTYFKLLSKIPPVITETQDGSVHNENEQS